MEMKSDYDMDSDHWKTLSSGDDADLARAARELR
jgi:hypothetical protein